MLGRLNAVQATHAVKLVFFNLSESLCDVFEPCIVALLHVGVDLFVRRLVLLLHLLLGGFEFALQLLDSLIYALLAPLDLQVQLLIRLTIEVLLKSLVGLFLKGIKFLVDHGELVFKLLGGLDPERRQ